MKTSGHPFQIVVYPPTPVPPPAHVHRWAWAQRTNGGTIQVCYGCGKERR